MGVRVKNVTEGRGRFSPLSPPLPRPPFMSPPCKPLSFLKFNIVVTRENKVPKPHGDTWPALRATLILSSLLKTRLDLLGGRVGFTTSLPQLYFDYRLDFCMLSIITIPFYMNISHDNLYAVNKNTVFKPVFRRPRRYTGYQL